MYVFTKIVVLTNVKAVPETGQFNSDLLAPSSVGRRHVGRWAPYHCKSYHIATTENEQGYLIAIYV